MLPKISRFRHYKDSRDKKLYIKNVKNTIKRENIYSYFLRIKIKDISRNIEIYSDVLEFLKKHPNSIVFASIDNHEYPNFIKLVNILDGENIKVMKESEVKLPITASCGASKRRTKNRLILTALCFFLVF